MLKPIHCLTVLAALSLGACEKPADKAEAAKSTASASAASGPDARPGLTVEGGRLVLPAVKGNPGAAYFVLDNRTGGTLILATLAIEGAGKAEIHQTMADKMLPVDRVEIAGGTNLKLEPGKLHAMVFDISPKLAVGGKTEMTLTFADGDKMSVPLSIEAAGGGSTEMEGMGHGEMH